MSKTLNLIYSSTYSPAIPESIGFFSKIKLAKGLILEGKKTINDFSAADEVEIGRGNGYAVFPELVDKNITLDAIRNQLSNRGVTNETFQNKLLIFILQSKLGIAFALSNIVLGLLSENDGSYGVGKVDLSFEVQNEHHVKIIFNHNLMGYPENNLSFQCHYEISIRPEQVVLNALQITLLSEKDSDKNTFAFLQANQASIWEKIIIFFKTLFNMNSDIVLEEKSIEESSLSPT